VDNPQFSEINEFKKYIGVDVCVYRGRETCVIPEGFEIECFSLKYNLMTSECKIYSVKVDLHYFK